MRPTIGGLAAVFSILLASCAGNGDLVSPQPYVVYHTDDNIEITQYFTGAQQRFDEAKAAELLTNSAGALIASSSAPKPKMAIHLLMPFVFIRTGARGFVRAAPLASIAKILSLKNKTDLAAAFNSVRPSSIRRFCPRFVVYGAAGQKGAAPRRTLAGARPANPKTDKRM